MIDKWSLESFQKASESFQQAMQWGQEQWQEAARLVSHIAEKPRTKSLLKT